MIGEPSISGNGVQLNAIDLPANVQGVFFHGTQAQNTPFGDGVLCVGGTVERVEPGVASNGAGVASTHVDLQALGFTAGETRYFQFWYRDPNGPGGSGFNLTHSPRVQFCH